MMNVEKITNRQAVEIFENIKLLPNSSEQLTASFAKYIGENESINTDALLRKIRRTKETIAKKRGKYKTDFEHQNFDIPVSTKVNDKAANISKTVYFENEAVNIAIKSIEKELTKKT